MSRSTRLLEHQRLCDDYAAKKRILAGLIPQEMRIKVETFLSAVGSDRVRSNAADQASLHLSTQIVATKLELDALQVEIDNARTQLAYEV